MADKQNKAVAVKGEPPKKNLIPVEVIFTEGYEQRFTQAVLKIYGNRCKAAENKQQAAV